MQLSLWKAYENTDGNFSITVQFLSVINPPDILRKRVYTKSIKIIKSKQNHKQTGKNVCDSQIDLCISFLQAKILVSRVFAKVQMLTQCIIALTNTDVWNGTKHDDVEWHLKRQVCVLEVSAASPRCRRGMWEELWHVVGNRMFLLQACYSSFVLVWAVTQGRWPHRSTV